LNPKGYKKYLINEFNKIYQTKCNYDQQCWLKQEFIKKMNETHKNELLTNTFRPTGPKGRFEWLSTIDIDGVIEQYEIKYPDFVFLGAVPIDFDDIDIGIRDLDLNDLVKHGKTRIGIVFNLDEHYKSGSHWVSAFIDLKKGQIYFSDSSGSRPEKRIRRFLRRVAKFCQNAGKTNLDVNYNKTQHQRGNSECGVYSINFILRLLKGETFKEITEKRLADDTVNKCRNVYFSNANF
jgi:hypothetical protein